MIPTLLVVLPFCQKDVVQARALLGWIGELRTTTDRIPHSILLAADKKVPLEIIRDMKAQALAIFHSADATLINVPDDRQAWPKGPNFMFHNVSQVVQQRYRVPWLWLEPDCVPLVDNWLDRLAWEYGLCPKHFMGTMATVALSPDLPERHMSGCAIYPTNAYEIMKEACASDIAFDYASAGSILGKNRAWETKLIYEIWGTHSVIPTFKAIKAPDDADNVLVPAVIPESAVLFHRCKDGSLIRLLRKQRSPQPEEVVKSFEAAPDPTPGSLPVAVEPEQNVPEVPTPVKEPKPKQKVRIGVPESKMAVI